jgi:glycosyltransferase involved in cell wall biosynthesis
MVSRMGIDVFLDALAQLEPDIPRFQAFLGGEGPDRGALEARAAASGLTGRVRFLGRLTDDEVAAAYAAADLFVLPTTSLECFGIITLEAFARGCPVVATSVGAIPEVVGPIQPQGLCPPGDSRSLARLLAAFLRGRLELPSARALKDYAEGRYGKSGVTRQYLAFLEGRNLDGDEAPAPDPGAAGRRTGCHGTSPTGPKDPA